MYVCMYVCMYVYMYICGMGCTRLNSTTVDPKSDGKYVELWQRKGKRSEWLEYVNAILCMLCALLCGRYSCDSHLELVLFIEAACLLTTLTLALRPKKVAGDFTGYVGYFETGCFGVFGGETEIGQLRRPSWLHCRCVSFHWLYEAT